MDVSPHFSALWSAQEAFSQPALVLLRDDDTMVCPRDTSDSTLMRLIAAGDEQALAAFYDCYKGLVYGLVLHVLGDRNAAEEATLDVFLKVWQQAHEFREERAAAKTWLATIARHHAIDMLRRRQSRRDQNIGKWVEDILESLPDPANVEQEVQEREVRQQVQAALASLSSEQRAVLLLAYFKGYSHSEIAKTLGQPLGSVKTRIRGALLLLRERLPRS